MRRPIRTAIVTLVILVVLSTIVSVEAQAPNNGQGNSIILAQNMRTDVGNPDAEAAVVAEYRDPNGSSADSLGTSVPPLASAEFLSSATALGDGWVGSMILYSDEQLATAANMLWDGGAYGDGKTAASYTGFGEGGTSDTWYLPRVSVYHGRQVSQIAVQNVDSAPATVWIEYYRRGESTTTAVISENIEVGGSRLYDLGSPGGKVPDLAGIVGDDWAGSAVIMAEDGKQITAMVVNHWKGTAAAHTGATSAGQVLIAPRLARRGRAKAEGFKWLEFGQIVLQNPNTGTTTVDVAFYERETGSLALLLSGLTIPGQEVLVLHLKNGGSVPASTFEVLDRDPGPDAGWNGKAVVSSTLPILGVATDRRGLQAASQYNMADQNEGSGTIYVPSVYRVLGAGGIRSRIAVANLSGDQASVDYYFYGRGGNLDLALNQPIAGNGIENNLLHASAFDPLGSDWVGSLYITSDKPIVAIVDTLWEGGNARLSTYNAIND